MQQQITETLVSFKVAELAKKKGFNLSTPKAYINGNLFTNFEESFGESAFYFDADDFHKHWNNKGWVFDINGNSCFGCSLDNKKYFDAFAAPTQSLLQKWLREVHNLHLYMDTTPSFEQMESHKSKYKVSVKVPFQPFKRTTGHYYLGNTYEEALEEGLFQALNLLTDKI